MSQQPFEIRIPDLVRNGVLLWALLGFVLIFGLISSIYTVEAESEGVILALASPEGQRETRASFQIAFRHRRSVRLAGGETIEARVRLCDRRGNQLQQFSDRRSRDREKNMVTGDLNAAEVEWIVQYRINDPEQYLFKVHDPEGTLRNISESVMRTIVGDRTVDEVITVGRQEIEKDAMEMMRGLVEKYELGIGVDQIQLKNVNPPLPVQASFNEVNQAEQEKARMINEAQGQYNKEVYVAEGVKDQNIEAAEGYALKRVNEAEGDVARFRAVLEEFEKAPEITKTRLYLEAMSEVVPQLGKKIIMDEDASQVLPLLQLQTDKGGFAK